MTLSIWALQHFRRWSFTLTTGKNKLFYSLYFCLLLLHKALGHVAILSLP